MKTTRLIYAGGLLLILSACAMGTKPTPREQLDYLDLDTFDQQLSVSLAANPSRMKIVSHGAIPLETIPPRMQKWLVATADTPALEDATVSMQRTDAKAVPIAVALFEVVGSDFISGLFKMIRENMLYSPAKNYEAVIRYENAPCATGSSQQCGVIREIVFKKKPA